MFFSKTNSIHFFRSNAPSTNLFSFSPLLPFFKFFFVCSIYFSCFFLGCVYHSWEGISRSQRGTTAGRGEEEISLQIASSLLFFSLSLFHLSLNFQSEKNYTKKQQKSTSNAAKVKSAKRRFSTARGFTTRLVSSPNQNEAPHLHLLRSKQAS